MAFGFGVEQRLAPGEEVLHRLAAAAAPAPGLAGRRDGVGIGGTVRDRTLDGPVVHVFAVAHHHAGEISGCRQADSRANLRVCLRRLLGIPNISSMLLDDHLRLAAATVHGLPRAELRLRSPEGEETVIARHPAADLTPCAFRRLVAEACLAHDADPGEPSLRVASALVGGGLVDLGGGVLGARTTCGREERWLGTTLGWQQVRSLLAATDGDDVRRAAIEATVAPDELLDVTLVGLTSSRADAVAALDRVAVDVAAALLADELVGTVRCAG